MEKVLQLQAVTQLLLNNSDIVNRENITVDCTEHVEMLNDRAD